MSEVTPRFKVEVFPAPRHEARLRTMGCLVRGCRREPIHLHHAKSRGAGGRPEDLVPLCWWHHVGPGGGHTMGWKTWERRNGLDLAACAAWFAFHSRALGILR